MKLEIIIDESHKSIYKDFIERHKNHKIVLNRILRNVERNDISISKNIFWQELIGCFLTTQQASGENSKVSKFLLGNDPILDVDYCINCEDIKDEAAKKFRSNGIRWPEKKCQSNRKSIKMDL